MVFTFDPPETGWTLNAQATIVEDVSAPSPPNSLHLNVGTGNDASCFRTLTGFAVGQTYQLWARLNFDGVSSAQPSVKFLYNANIIGSAQTKTEATGWELRHIGSFNYAQRDRTFTILGVQVGGALGSIKVDAIYIGQDPPSEDAMASKWGAIDAAVQVMRGIDGSASAFNTNFEGRVYSRLFFPHEQPGTVKLPYACVPLDQEGEQIEYEGFAFTSTWRLTGYAFFEDDTESHPLESSGAQAAAKFRDDLIRAFMADQSLGGETQNCIVTAIDTAAAFEGDATTWVVFTIEFTQMAGASDLEVA